MVEYSKENEKLTDTQLKKLKTAFKNKTGTTVRMSWKMHDGHNLPRELLLITRQKTKQRNTFSNNMPADVKLPKAQVFKIAQSGRFLGSLLSKLACPLLKVEVPLAENILAALGITAAASAFNARIEKKIHGSGTTILIISNEEINDMMKIVQALENSNIL